MQCTMNVVPKLKRDFAFSYFFGERKILKKCETLLQSPEIYISLCLLSSLLSLSPFCSLVFAYFLLISSLHISNAFVLVKYLVLRLCVVCGHCD